MSQPETYAVVILESVSHALQAEKLFKTENIPCKLIPVPRHLSSDCGVCLRFRLYDRDRVESMLAGKIEHFMIALL